MAALALSLAPIAHHGKDMHSHRLAGIAVAFTLMVLPGAGRAQARVDVPKAFDRREIMIAMRDGVQLFTVVLTPKNAREPLPIILSRTPYGTGGWGGTSGIDYGFKELMDDAGGYIFAFQDIRGRFKSQGTFVMNRPPRNERDAKSTDESTDTYDTIEWLTKNVAGNNGRVGMVGISYPGWLADVGVIGAHPALKAVSPQATMGDTWMGDDFFHQGAFRLTYGLEYAWSLEASRDGSVVPTPGRHDTYEWYRAFPTLDSLAKAVGALAWPTWQRFVAHPSYDSVWQARSLPRRMRATSVPMLTVGGWWDQEDLYGPQATYRSIEPSDAAHRNFIAIGPWFHGEWFEEAGDSLGNARFGSATGEYFRREIQAPWFAYYLKGKGDGRFPEARVFDAGDSTWRSYDAWPPATAKRTRLYLRGNGKLSLEQAPSANEGKDSFVSDPAHPVPYRPRPVEWTYSAGSRWTRWMTEDQRFVDGRPDILTWQTEPLEQDVRIAGNISAHLIASTTGSDADWVVKLIDVYPDSMPKSPRMRGYELMIAGDIMRGRYRNDFSKPEAIAANSPVPFTVDLHGQAYTFRKGHRIMVQVQSTWFPLYDRNPQTFVPNIFMAKASDYRAQTHSVYHDAAHASYVEVPVVPSRGM